MIYDNSMLRELDWKSTYFSYFQEKQKGNCNNWFTNRKI